MILFVFNIFYRVLWLLALPLVMLYLWKRGRKDPRYLYRMKERLGFYEQALPQHPLWVHAVSLGEVRSALGLIRLALARGEKIVISCFTPAGREEAERQFADEIVAGDLAVIWVPLDMHWCLHRFFRACRPRFGLTLEVEIWPAMIASARRAKVPLYLCNSQYTSGAYAKDSRGLRVRQRVIASVAGAFVKSDIQRQRFASVGVKNITVTGELRFDQPIPEALLDAAAQVRPQLIADGRQVITIASGVAGEEEIFRDMILSLHAAAAKDSMPAPLFVYVPRAPERFGAVGQMLQSAGLSVCARSQVAEAGTAGLVALGEALADMPDVLLGDSFGEMYFYLGLADQVIVGGGFTPAGAHNIIEPLAVGKPPITGPQTWPIEFPFVEAEAAGVAKSFDTPEAMAAVLWPPREAPLKEAAIFMAEHRGASARTLEAMDQVLMSQNGKSDGT
ncbi:3-deoxy-D-manno-octulosonic acid transferase [Shimia marina]|uniref:3-deoxy-D-manno-octulosonic acid transferase n=1 Tax=Shimia marina TaxID=321267 RepID=A0A0P1EKB9_9RHOB|nr:glycosyltransferase N-terminal domain-containing protein [Shimia marina]CUH50574.1 3-deoxy-D-manno-octulosonic acid transferase [Shimia marina]SFE40052.1 3-deoxy-D-manno-octulosonic-acid transferase [Shimia marina]